MRHNFMNGLFESAKKFSNISEDLLLQSRGELLSAYKLWLSRFFSRDESRTDNLEPVSLLTAENCEIATDNVKVARNKLFASKFNLVHIEPILDLAKVYESAGLTDEYEEIMIVYNFALGMRRLYRKFITI